MEINDKNLIQLLDAANYLECEKAKTTISYYIFRKLNLKNYLFYFKISKLYNLKRLTNYLCNYLLQQYILNEDKNSFFQLNFEEICLIFSCSELQISSELELFNAAVDWINYKPNERTKHMNTVLKLIRLPLIPKSILTHVVRDHKLCRNDKNCKQTIKKAIKSKSSCKNKASNIQFQNRFYQCMFEPNEIMLIGGIKGSIGKESDTKTLKNNATYYFLHVFNSKKHIIPCFTTSKMQEPRKLCKTAVIGNKVYCFGGRETYFNDTSSEVYCRKSNTWSLIAPFPRFYLKYCCVCSFMNKVYVFGDLRGNNWVFDPVENNWNIINDCNVKRYNAACTVFEGQCVVIGGKKQSHRSKFDTILKSIEKYDHYLNKWSFLADMQTARYEAEVVTKGNKIFIFGGYCLDKSEVYDSISKKFCYIAKFWNGCPDPINPMIFGDYIIVYRGNCIYKYDINKDKWSRRDYTHLNEQLPYDCSFVKVNKMLT